MRHRLFGFFVVLLLTIAGSANAQYFGRNKVQWENFHFKVLRTEHFDIYYYDQEADVVNDVGRMAERWYARLSRLFNHSFNRKPIVLYANAADFQQTTTTPELIGEGTGGFTDPFMNRVVLPLTGDYAENDHVLGHELVHVFQFDVAATMNNARRRFNLEQMPLWLVEGMAEYLSKGRIDPLTSMWIRDAAIHNRLPDLKKLTRDPRYFPYRYGQALLAYIGGRFGDDAVVRYFIAAGGSGIEPAFERVLGISSKQLFTDWQASAHELYDPIVADRPANMGTPLIGSAKGARGSLNIGPAYSPDGRYIAFLSTRDIFDVDLFLADAKTGRVIRRLLSTARDSHMDALRFIDSAGSWSPDSRHLAVVTYEKGDNYLGIVDVDRGRTEHIRVPGVDAINTVAWSPDGHTVALSGQATGVSDLYTYDINTKQVRQLTNDKWADLQPAWSPDGRTIAFVTDRGGSMMEQLHFNQMQIATIDVATDKITVLPLFANTKEINPQYSPDGDAIYFIANPEGIPDVYRYRLSDNTVARITHVETGVAGITDLSPALSVASKTGEIAFSLFEDDNYNIYTLPSNASGVQVATTQAPEAPRGSLLPPLRGTGSEITAYLEHPEQGLLPTSAENSFRHLPYSSSLHLAYLGPPSVGVGVGTYGTGVGGTVAAYWSDVLGRQTVGFAFEGGVSSGYGSVADQIGAEVDYLNQAKRFNWGGTATHIPYISAFTTAGQEVVTVNGQQVLADVIQQERQIIRFDDVSALAQYPFSTTRRFEMSAGIQHQSQRTDVETLIAVGDQVLSDTVQRLGDSFSINLFRGSAAFVGDNSVFGFISPVRGMRYRVEAEELTGDLHFQTALLDGRKYFFMRPVTLALRGISYGRYGRDAEDPRLFPLYIGQDALVRGYDIGSIGLGECGAQVTTTGACPVFDRLIGSRIAVANAELRVPLLGTREYGLINAPYLPTELEVFGDSGLAWNKGDHPKIRFERNTEDRVPVFSVGVGVRVLLSYIPLEFYMAKPFQRPDKGYVYGFNIMPGW
jgi:Tol biopolymer transport system component